MAGAEVRDYSELVADITVSGALQHLGGGVYRRVVDDIEQRWLATLLPPETVAELLDLCGPAGTPDDAMHACLKPDCDLAVTCLVITANSREYEHVLDEIAANAVRGDPRRGADAVDPPGRDVGQRRCERTMKAATMRRRHAGRAAVNWVR